MSGPDGGRDEAVRCWSAACSRAVPAVCSALSSLPVESCLSSSRHLGRGQQVLFGVVADPDRRGVLDQLRVADVLHQQQPGVVAAGVDHRLELERGVEAPQRRVERLLAGLHQVVVGGRRDDLGGAGRHELGPVAVAARLPAVRVREDDADPVAGVRGQDPLDLGVEVDGGPRGLRRGRRPAAAGCSSRWVCGPARKSVRGSGPVRTTPTVTTPSSTRTVAAQTRSSFPAGGEGFGGRTGWSRGRSWAGPSGSTRGGVSCNVCRAEGHVHGRAGRGHR